MSIISFIFVLAYSFIIADSFILNDDLVDYRLLAAQNFTTPFLGIDDCGKGNVLVCQDCTSMGLCMDNGNNDWTLIDAGKCPNGETCLEGRCTKEPNPSCSPLNSLDFLCTTTGMFPNPTDCQSYYFCIKDPLDGRLMSYSDTCTDNYGYNPKTTFCSKKLKVGGCTRYPVPVCNKLGEIAALSDNPTLYYVCIKRPLPGSNEEVLYPVIHACEHGGTFNRFSGQCR